MRSQISGIPGFESSTVSHTERLVSALGSFLVILLVFYTGQIFLGPTGTLLIVPSMGASAVLLFAVPHGALSQPWNVLGGHLVSAVVGVSCAILVPHQIAAAPEKPQDRHVIEHADLVSALSQIDSFIDISEHDLLQIYELATRQAEQRQLQPAQIILGHYYSNGAFGADWCIRQVVDESSSPDPEKDMIIFKVVAGAGDRETGTLTRTAFASWARHELLREGENWKHVSAGETGAPGNS